LGSNLRLGVGAAQVAGIKSFCSDDERLGIGVRREVMSDVTVLQEGTRAVTNQGRGWQHRSICKLDQRFTLFVSRMLGSREVGSSPSMLLGDA
jgi:hypothetical protein